MARRPHLTLKRLDGELERRKRPGFGGGPPRDHQAHGSQLRQQLAEIVQRTSQRNAEDVNAPPDPTVILRINTVEGGYLAEDALEGSGLQILEQRGNQATIVISKDPQLTVLRQRTDQYAGPIPVGQKGARHAGLFGVVDSFDELEPNDRIGTALSRHGFAAVEAIDADTEFLVDVELWDIDDRLVRELHINRIERTARNYGGELLSQYRGAGLFVARLRTSGLGLRELLTMNEVAWIDLPPVPDFAPDEGAEITTAQLPPIDPPPGNAVCIGIIDSGIIAAHPMLEGVVAGAFGVPERFGSDDERRHGTAVAALASYGSVAEQIQQDRLRPRFRIASAKVVDGRGKFDEDRSVADIVEEAIRRLHGEFGCRVINVSLADIEHLVGGRPSNWAMTLDNLVRELGVIVTVSAGNIGEISQRMENEGLDIYPHYLLEDENRLYEPASSVSSLVVGSLAHGNGLMPDDAHDVDIVAITDAHHPSPFSRSGPGFNDAIKPDVAEYGGTAVWSGFSARLSADRESCGVLTLNPNYLQSLMEYRHGTSFAAPAVAFKAAALLDEFPNASANFIRALLGLGTDHPKALLDRVTSENGREHYRFAGYGVSDLNLAIASDDGRVVMAVEDSLPVDRFAVYQVPIPTDFQTAGGTRHIKVSLAFDPPVKNSRKEYLGIKMGYQLVRGKSAAEVFERFRKWEVEEKDEAGGEAYTFEKRYLCDLKPNITMREAGTLQVGSYVRKRDMSGYGDNYFLVVRCEGKWAANLVEQQTFAVAVELWHEALVELYQEVALRA